MARLDDPRAHRILALFAEQAHIDVGRLTWDTRTDELGLSALDLAFALFEIEDRFGVDLPRLTPDGAAQTVGAVVREVLDRLDHPGRAPSPTAH